MSVAGISLGGGPQEIPQTEQKEEDRKEECKNEHLDDNQKKIRV